MKSVLIFFSLLVLLILIGLSGAATHAVFAAQLAKPVVGPPGFGLGFLLFLHLLAACVMVGGACSCISDANNKS
jgi:hypothetical protein